MNEGKGVSECETGKDKLFSGFGRRAGVVSLTTGEEGGRKANRL